MGAKGVFQPMDGSALVNLEGSIKKFDQEIHLLYYSIIPLMIPFKINNTLKRIKNIKEYLYKKIRRIDIFNHNLLSFYKGISFYNRFDYNNIMNTIFEKIIKYKNIGGIKFQISGRLTKRYRADRAVFVRRILGGLNNIDSSFKRIPSVILRGYMNCNVEYAILTSKRRIGAFAVKG